MMIDERRNAAERTAAQTGAEGHAAHGAPPEDIGHGPGLDPPAEPPDDDAEPGDEAYADRPAGISPSAPKDGREPVGQSDYTDYTDVAAIQRPPADS
ncbi:hypothetical protein [Sorangium sp. So ce394]|uniref:hypothetical protein n=1 Tax=Sorangium sp. So ce394 TaxID=3133310 RepID=UPI003F5CB8AD